jgi:DNA-binding MarR family transcriptional regulator
MSIQLIKEIWQLGRDLELKPRNMLVLLALAYYFNDDEQAAWPSVATLTKHTPYNESAVQYALRSLVKLGHISVEPDPAGKNGKGGRRRSTRYLVHPKTALVAAPLREKVQQRAPDPLVFSSSSSLEERTTATTEAAVAASSSSTAKSVTTNARTREAKTVPEGVRPAQGDDAVAAVVRAYHEHCPRLPKVRAVPPERRKRVVQALKTVKLAQWVEIFKRAARSSFLAGANDRAWRADFDWFFGRGRDGIRNATKVLDGKYDDRPGQRASPPAVMHDFPTEGRDLVARLEREQRAKALAPGTVGNAAQAPVSR